jgi:hypothetical protein
LGSCIGFFKLSDGLMIATCPVPYEFSLALPSHNSLLGSVEMFVKDFWICKLESKCCCCNLIQGWIDLTIFLFKVSKMGLERV